MAGYTKEFLLAVYVSRFEFLGLEVVESMHALGSKCYDEHGKDAFRKYASVDADAIKLYKENH